MQQSIFVGSSITTRGGDAQVHGRMLPVAPIELAKLLLGASQADLETFDLAEPAFRLGFVDAGEEVVADVDEPCPLGRPVRQLAAVALEWNCRPGLLRCVLLPAR
ncbi:hypothetical protein ABZZ80_39000 [Streptomyces sp. NPDC006356]